MTITTLNHADCPWLVAPDTRAVLAALDAISPGATRFVGGCVRNAIMGRPVDDIDLATQLSPQDVIKAGDVAGLKVVPTGLAHGTVTLVSGDTAFEVTTLRRDVSTDGRNATIAHTDDWVEDSQRRDFRLNAIYADGDGVLFDPQNGVEDALAGRVVFIGDADTRIEEDYLRILRFFRFNAWYGADIDADGLAACARGVKGLRRLSVERVWKELKKLLGAPNPLASMEAMMGSSVLETILPEAMALELFGALIALEQAEGWEPDAMLRLAALMPRMGRVADRVKTRLKLSNADASRLMEWSTRTYNPRLLLEKSDAEVAKTIYTLHVPALVDRARLAWALDAAKGEANSEDWRPLIATMAGWEKPVFPLSGKDLIAAGMEKGPKVGAVLQALEQLWINSGFELSNDALVQALGVLLKGEEAD